MKPWVEPIVGVSLKPLDEVLEDDNSKLPTCGSLQ